MSLPTPLSQRLQLLSQRWLAKRIPAAAQQQLHHRSLFIFPTAFGMGYLCLLLGLLLMGTNYQNNLMLLLAYFLLSVFLLSLFYSYFNLAGAQLEASCPARAAAGTSIGVQLQLTRPHHQQQKPRFHSDAVLTWQGQTVPASLLNLSHGSTVLPYLLQHRGKRTLPRITLSSCYPFGLFRCWTHLDFALTVSVYPTPIPCVLHLVAKDNLADADVVKNSSRIVNDGEDADELRQYIPGDALQRVAWKHVAKGGNWQTRQRTAPFGQQGWLVFDASAARETALGKLSYQVLALAERQQAFGLCLPHLNIPIDEGEQHITACLEALANTPSDSEQRGT